MGVTARVLSVAAVALSAVPAQAALAAPHEDPRTEVARLFHQAESATEAYDKAGERADELRREVDEGQDRLARQQERVNSLRQTLGSLAGAQYRSGGIDPTVALLLSDDPDHYLQAASLLDRIGVHQADQLHHLRGELRELTQQRAETAGKLAELEKSRKAVAAHKRTVVGKLAAARRVLGALPTAERAGLLGAAGGDDAALSALGGGPPASGRAADALAAARQALGRPYVWGANGPLAFDCSGLMQWAYARAGVALPRTSQEQRNAGRRVPLSQARPGDLVTYRADASHVAMYIGAGRVIHAPHPGAPVRVDPVGMMPVSAVTRI
jgi:cell wall-associated NlpC family hydrolase